MIVNSKKLGPERQLSTIQHLETAISKKQFFTIQTAQMSRLKCQTQEKHYLNQKMIKSTKLILNLEIPL